MIRILWLGYCYWAANRWIWDCLLAVPSVPFPHIPTKCKRIINLFTTCVWVVYFVLNGKERGMTTKHIRSEAIKNFGCDVGGAGEAPSTLVLAVFFREFPVTNFVVYLLLLACTTRENELHIPIFGGILYRYNSPTFMCRRCINHQNGYWSNGNNSFPPFPMFYSNSWYVCLLKMSKKQMTIHVYVSISILFNMWKLRPMLL